MAPSVTGRSFSRDSKELDERMYTCRKQAQVTGSITQRHEFASLEHIYFNIHKSHIQEQWFFALDSYANDLSDIYELGAVAFIKREVGKGTPSIIRIGDVKVLQTVSHRL